MFTDMTGKRRLKVGLHTHTTVSDGHKTPEEVAAIYKNAGYDAIALTDHWVYGAGGEIGGLTILSGCEYNVGGVDEWTGVHETYHIVGIGMTRDPAVPEEYVRNQDGRIRDRVRDIVRLIREAGGLAVLAHPAWSLNTSEQILGCGNFDATEIYNSVSDWGMSDRPYSGIIVDQIASYGMFLPLLATDDTHYYNGDECRGWVAVEADAAEELGLVESLRQGRFYATQGPEVHLERISHTAVRLTCSPAVKIAFLSNSVWSAGRMVRGEDLTEATYEFKRHEIFVRAEVTDACGRVGYSNIIPV
ncbi:MAG: hypothetical protein IJA91_01845 [Clostridia bacterium]|nr:hypothetical protein [Clostridia bacterium]